MWKSIWQQDWVTFSFWLKENETELKIKSCHFSIYILFSYTNLLNVKLPRGTGKFALSKLFLVHMINLCFCLPLQTWKQAQESNEAEKTVHTQNTKRPGSVLFWNLSALISEVKLWYILILKKILHVKVTFSGRITQKEGWQQKLPSHNLY